MEIESERFKTKPNFIKIKYDLKLKEIVRIAIPEYVFDR